MANGFLMSHYNGGGDKVCYIPKNENPFQLFGFQPISSAAINDEFLNHSINLEDSTHDRINYLYTMKLVYPKSTQLDNQPEKLAENCDQIYGDSNEYAKSNKDANEQDVQEDDDYDVEGDDHYDIAGCDKTVLLFFTHFKNPYDCILAGLQQTAMALGCASSDFS